MPSTSAKGILYCPRSFLRVGGSCGVSGLLPKYLTGASKSITWVVMSPGQIADVVFARR